MINFSLLFLRLVRRVLEKIETALRFVKTLS